MTDEQATEAIEISKTFAYKTIKLFGTIKNRTDWEGELILHAVKNHHRFDPEKAAWKTFLYLLFKSHLSNELISCGITVRSDGLGLSKAKRNSKMETRSVQALEDKRTIPFIEQDMEPIFAELIKILDGALPEKPSARRFYRTWDFELLTVNDCIKLIHALGCLFFETTSPKKARQQARKALHQWVEDRII